MSSSTFSPWNDDNEVEFKLASLADSGPGKAWVAECHKPWKAGDKGATTYLQSAWDTFYLTPGRGYFRHEPTEVECEDGPGEGEPEIGVRRFYIRVRQDGEVEEISPEFANQLLREQVRAEKRRLAAPQVEVKAKLKGNKLTVTTERGSVTLNLPAKGAKQADEGGGPWPISRRSDPAPTTS